MKKYLSLVLAVMMVLSSAVFAAPVAVGTIETAQEVVLDASEAFEANVAEEATGETETVTTDLATLDLIAKFTFDNLDEQVLQPQVPMQALTLPHTHCHKAFLH